MISLPRSYSPSSSSSLSPHSPAVSNERAEFLESYYEAYPKSAWRTKLPALKTLKSSGSDISSEDSDSGSSIISSTATSVSPPVPDEPDSVPAASLPATSVLGRYLSNLSSTVSQFLGNHQVATLDHFDINGDRPVDAETRDDKKAEILKDATSQPYLPYHAPKVAPKVANNIRLHAFELVDEYQDTIVLGCPENSGAGVIAQNGNLHDTGSVTQGSLAPPGTPTWFKTQWELEDIEELDLLEPLSPIGEFLHQVPPLEGETSELLKVDQPDSGLRRTVTEIILENNILLSSDNTRPKSVFTVPLPASDSVLRQTKNLPEFLSADASRPKSLFTVPLPPLDDVLAPAAYESSFIKHGCAHFMYSGPPPGLPVPAHLAAPAYQPTPSMSGRVEKLVDDDDDDGIIDLAPSRVQDNMGADLGNRYRKPKPARHHGSMNAGYDNYVAERRLLSPA